MVTQDKIIKQPPQIRLSWEQSAIVEKRAKAERRNLSNMVDTLVAQATEMNLSAELFDKLRSRAAKEQTTIAELIAKLILS